jgi:transposase
VRALEYLGGVPAAIVPDQLGAVPDLTRRSGSSFDRLRDQA